MNLIVVMIDQGHILDLMYPHTIGAISRSSFIKPASKSGASYGSGELMCVEPRLKGYSKKLLGARVSPSHTMRETSNRNLLEHCEKLSWWHEHMISKPPSNDRIMHDRLVRFVFEVRVPTALEVWRGPFLHFLQLLLGWTDFNTSFNPISSQWTSTFEIPFIKDSFLDFWDASDEVVKTFCV
jgi:hypothetical protein